MISCSMRGYTLRRGRRKKWMIDIAQERVDILFDLADKELISHPQRSYRYVELARKIAQKYNLKLSPPWKTKFCTKCQNFLKPGYNCRIRLIDQTIILKCLECGHIMKKPYQKEKKERRRIKIESHTFKKGINEPLT